MERLIRQSWWKWLGVAILLYVFAVGMLVPLKPGLTRVDPGGARTGESVTLRIQGYNTHFASTAAEPRVWLKLDEERALAAQAIQVHSDMLLEASFQLPDYLPSSDRVVPFTVIMDNELDGYALRPSALLVTQDSIQPELGGQAWPNAAITNLHQHEGITFPFRNILAETIRNTYFHVSLWLAMMILFIAALVFSIRYLRRNDLMEDAWAQSLTSIGIFFGLLGLITGAIWAKYTWGQFWSWDIKQFTTMIGLIIYLAYFVLRFAFPDPEQRARISAAFNIFAFAALIPLIYVIPRLTDSLHPGNGGNPALGGEDLDNTMRMVFYPAVIGWTLVGAWMASLLYRAQRIQDELIDRAY